MYTMARYVIVKDIIQLGTPIILMSVIGFLSSAVGILMLSHFGALEMAASALATATVMTISAMVGTTLMSVSIRVSFFRGKKAEQITFITILKSGLCLGFMLSLVGAIVIWFAPQWLELFHHNADLIARTTLYFHIASLFVLLAGLFTAWVQFFNGMGKTMIGTWLSIVRLPFALIAMYGFIFGKWGLPQLQLGGVIVGQTIALGATLMVLVVYTLRQPIGRLMLTTALSCEAMITEMRALFSLGWPIGLQYGGELAAMTVALYMLGAFGADALAAQQIVSQYSLIIIMFAIGIAQAASILISKVHGEKNIMLAHRIMAISVCMIIGLFMIFMIVIALWGHPILQIFYNHNLNTNHHVKHLAYVLLWIALFILFFDSLRNVFAFGLRSIGFPKSPMTIGVACLWLLSIPCAYLCGFHFFHNALALRLGFSVGFVAGAFILWWMWHKKMRIRIDTE